MLAVDFLVVKSVKLKLKLVKMREIKYKLTTHTLEQSELDEDIVEYEFNSKQELKNSLYEFLGVSYTDKKGLISVPCIFKNGVYVAFLETSNKKVQEEYPHILITRKPHEILVMINKMPEHDKYLDLTVFECESYEDACKYACDYFETSSKCYLS